ncbi:NADP-dependent phosphogluconate dehydrogenase [Vibrio cholerae]
MKHADIAMIGLGVMGRSLALNLVEHGFQVTGYDISDAHRQRASDEAKALSSPDGALLVASDLKQLITALSTPRVIALSVPAGEIVDNVIDDLLAAGLEPQDIVIDTGNSLWRDSEAREARYDGQCHFFSTAVSGGEVGARHGPSLMASGNPEAWQRIQPMWTAIAAKVDNQGQPVGSFDDGEPCAAYLGPAGAGHYVKMVHNGIEYADMQLICEAYHFMSSALALSAREVGEIFTRWNQGVLNSYLLEISADILQTQDPVTGAAFVDIVLDKAEQKGTGLWTAVNALQSGIPAPTIAQAVFSRAQSSQKSLRLQAACHFDDKYFDDNHFDERTPALKAHERDAALSDLHDALYCAKLVAYAQGFDLMSATSKEQGWDLDFAAIAKIWRAGCIIRAGFLHSIRQAFDADPTLAHLLLAPTFSAQLKRYHQGFRHTIARTAQLGVPMPAMSSALHYFDGLRTPILPANLLQAQRDYFGSHTYSRTDEDERRKFHLNWSDVPRTQSNA